MAAAEATGRAARGKALGVGKPLDLQLEGCRFLASGGKKRKAAQAPKAERAAQKPRVPQQPCGEQWFEWREWESTPLAISLSRELAAADAAVGAAQLKADRAYAAIDKLEPMPYFGSRLGLPNDEEVSISVAEMLAGSA